MHAELFSCRQAIPDSYRHASSQQDLKTFIPQSPIFSTIVGFSD